MTDDDDLRELLRRADPAATLAPAAPDQVRHLTEEAMSRTHTRRWALPVAAALVLLAGGAAWAMTHPTPPEVPQAIGTVAPTVTLDATDAPASCVGPDPSWLSERSDFAFEGTVSKVDADRVTLTVTTVFRGQQAADVQVALSGSHSYGNDRFEVGKSYLVASADGTVLICSSGLVDGFGLRKLYEEAF
ncbi:MAG TPA: hypothetical protein VN408_26135 [Actinoplanes sp.]|nr:hypothetical protein [Actinoplanes sp.]